MTVAKFNSRFGLTGAPVPSAQPRGVRLLEAQRGGGVTRDRVLLAFERKDGGVLSGATIARQLGVTRTAVWKHIRALKAEGIPLKTVKRNGYRLNAPFDFSLLRKRGLQALGFWKMHYLLSIPSTQNLAKQAAIEDAPQGHFWLAERQTAGRGRLDRVWESPYGGLWFSLLLRPPISPASVPALTLVASLCLAETLQALCRFQALLKWPNDVVARTPDGWRKIGGILTDMSAELDRAEWVVIGVGINVNNPISSALQSIAVSLSRLIRHPVSRAGLLRAFLLRFEAAYLRFQKAGFTDFRDRYWSHYSRPGEAVQLKTSQGMLEGDARGVDGHGALIVESKNRLHVVWEGEIV